MYNGSRIGREAFAAALQSSGLEAAAGATGMTAEALAKIDVVLIFTDGPASKVVESIHKCSSQFAGTSIVLVGANHSDDEIAAFIEAGARTYTTSQATLDELISTIRAVRAGESPCSGRVGALVSAKLAEFSKALRDTAAPGALTAREQEVLRLIAKGLSNKEIAAQLSITLNTTKIHVHRILEKLQVRRRREAARWASTRASSA